MARVDIVVPCHQFGRSPRDCISSVLGQLFDDLRILIIVNAASGTATIAHELAKTDRRIEVSSREPSIDWSAMYNEGIDWATSDLMMFIEPDTHLTRKSIDRAVLIMEARPDLSFAYGTELPPSAMHSGVQSLLHSSAELTHGGQDAGWWIMDGPDFIANRCAAPSRAVGSCAVVRRTAFQKQAGHYRNTARERSETEMWLRLATVGNVAGTAAIQGFCGEISDVDATGQRRLQRRHFEGLQEAFEQFFSHVGNSFPNWRALQKLARRQLSIAAFWYGQSRMTLGDASNGESCILFAISLDPVTALPRTFRQVAKRQLPLRKLGRYLLAAFSRWTPVVFSFGLVGGAGRDPA